MDKKATESIRIYADSLAILDQRKAALRAKGTKPSYADLVRELLDSAMPNTEPPAAQPAAHPPPMLEDLTQEELYLAAGLIAGWRAKDTVIAGTIQLLRARIGEKGYAPKETAGKRAEHPRRKVAG